MSKAKIFTTLNQFVDKTFVLTIERASERHDLIKAELNGLNFEFVYGIDKQNLDLKNLITDGIYGDMRAKRNHRYHKSLTLGEIACSMGHKMIYEKMLEQKFDKVLILEDDVFVNEVNFDEGIENLPNDWDVIYLDYFKNETKPWWAFFKQEWYHVQRFFGLLNYSHKTIKNLYAKKINNNISTAGFHDYASAYIISKKAAQVLIELQTPIQFPADHVLPYAITNKLLKGFILHPKLFSQKSQTNKVSFGSFVED